MRLILARHGNTFGPGDTPVWVGASEDYDLVESGLEQSRAIGRALLAAGVAPRRIIAGPLKRTCVGARLAAEACGFAGEIEIDDRLREIDYGTWGGRTDAEIIAQWGADALADWRDRSIAPSDAGWSPAPETIRANARAMIAALEAGAEAGGDALVVTSNGVLKYFHALLAPDTEPGGAKTGTGRMSAARLGPDGYTLLFWNALPEDATERLK